MPHAPVLIAGVTVLLLIGCSSHDENSNEPRTNDSPGSVQGALPATAVERLELRAAPTAAAGERVPLPLALDAFATLIAPIPGGTPESGEILPDQSGTLAVRWILGAWPKLTDKQRAVVEKAILGDSITRAGPPPTLSSSPAPSATPPDGAPPASPPTRQPTPDNPTSTAPPPSEPSDNPPPTNSPPTNPPPTGAAPTTASQTATPAGQAAAARPGVRQATIFIKHAAGVDPQTDLEAKLAADIAQINLDLTEHYGLPHVNVDVVVSTTGKNAATASPIELTQDNAEVVPNFRFHGKSKRCLITVEPPGVQIYENYNAGKAGTFSYNLAFLAHEVYHCIQYTYFNDIANFYDSPDWLMEGSAEWADLKWAYDTTQTAYEVQLRDAPGDWARVWNSYLGLKTAEDMAAIGTAQRSLFSRDYNAAGFYAHIENFGADPWTTIPRMIRTVTTDTSTNNERVLNAAVPDGRDADFWQNWATGLTRDPEKLGDAWDTTGPGITDYRYEPETHPVQDTGRVSLTSLPAAAERHRLLFDNPENGVLHIATSAYGVFAWIDASKDIVEDRFDRLPSGGQDQHNYCIDPDGCYCPDGSPIPTLPPLEASPVREPIEAFVAFTGASHQGSVDLELQTAEQLCAPEGDGRTGVWDNCQRINDAQVGELIGRPVFDVPFPEGCHWMSQNASLDRTNLLVAPLPLHLEWDQLVHERTRAGWDCTAELAGIRACTVDDAIDQSTDVVAWAGPNSIVGVDVTAQGNHAPAMTKQGRLDIIEEVLQTLLKDQPLTNADSPPLS